MGGLCLGPERGKSSALSRSWRERQSVRGMRPPTPCTPHKGACGAVCAEPWREPGSSPEVVPEPTLPLCEPQTHPPAGPGLRGLQGIAEFDA